MAENGCARDWTLSITLRRVALLPPYFLDAVVAFEKGPDENGDFKTVASGVLLGFDTKNVNEGGDKLYTVGLVTNRHVVEGEPSLWTKFNKGDASARYKVDLVDGDGTAVWRSHADFDVAVIPVNVKILQDEGADFRFVPEDVGVGYVDEMKELGVFAGDDIYVLGFPMGLAGVERKYAVVRGGVLARLDDEVIDHENAFWVDAAVYPGNSGGPVVLRPQVLAIQGTKAISKAYIIGIVSGFIPYVDIAVSQQTRRPRIIFEENSGLAAVVPMDAVREAFAEFLPPPPKAPESEPGEIVTASLGDVGETFDGD